MYKTSSPFNWKYHPKYEAFYPKTKHVPDWKKEKKEVRLSFESPNEAPYYEIKNDPSHVHNFVALSKQTIRKAIYKEDPNYKEYIKTDSISKTHIKSTFGTAKKEVEIKIENIPAFYKLPDIKDSKLLS